MNIVPLKGVDKIEFGIFNNDIQKLLGEPDAIENFGASVASKEQCDFEVIILNYTSTT